MDEKIQQEEEIKALIKQMSSFDEKTHMAALEQVSKYGELAVPHLIRELYKRRNNVQKIVGVGDALSLIGEPAIPALVEALKSVVATIHAQVSLGMMEDKNLVVHYILKLLESEQQYMTSFSALTVLANTAIKIRNSIGALKSNVALEALQKLAQYHNNEDVRFIAEKFIEVDTHRYGYL